MARKKRLDRTIIKPRAFWKNIGSQLPLLHLGGALAGSPLYRFWGLRTVYLSVVPLLAVIATDQGHPLSIEEEKEQSER